eukprot:GILK01013335.1.p1 GENE.GILK01013335.1~~GILK01013335.1.p1  ORF type:complete len:203 (+),score=16.73 GILK01013335.1:41-610(+)
MADSVVEEVATVFRDFGQGAYVGDVVSLAEHSLQAAKLATDAGVEEEVILGALLHDIGHMVGLKDGAARMSDVLGVTNHEGVGAEWLRTRGISSKVCDLVGQHVQAKRYLTFSQSSYYEKLSDTSKATLACQGGPMSAEEAERFDLNPLKHSILLMRTWDEKAKIANKDVPPFENYRDMLRRHVSSGVE